MKLNLNFDGFTKLRDWWNTVQSNFKIIETECNKTRTIADNACTKEEARVYINEFIGLSDEYMAAIEAFTELYKKNESIIAAMDEVYGGRLKYYSKEDVFDANDAIGEDAIFFCKAETENTPANQTGILISKTDNKQMWIAENGEIFYRQYADDVWSEWTSMFSEINKELLSLYEAIENTKEYQKPWNTDETVDAICVNADNLEIFVNTTTKGSKEKTITMINSGTVILYFEGMYSGQYPDNPVVNIFVNDELVKTYIQEDLRYGANITDSSGVAGNVLKTTLSVNKGDIIKLVISAATYSTNDYTGLRLKNIKLLANIETPYKYVNLI